MKYLVYFSLALAAGGAMAEYRSAQDWRILLWCAIAGVLYYSAGRMSVGMWK